MRKYLSSMLFPHLLGVGEGKGDGEGDGDGGRSWEGGKEDGDGDGMGGRGMSVVMASFYVRLR